MNKKYLIGLKTTEYEHPFDKMALETLRRLPGFDTFTNFILNWIAVKWEMVAKQGSNFHITRESCLELYNQVKESAKVLDVKDFPEIYTQWGYRINGYTTGNKDMTMLVLESGAIDLLTNQELDYVIGHEMGHIKSGHVIYHMMAQLFNSAIGLIPLGEALTTPIRYALFYWNRMSEFTADRAGLLSCQDKEAAIKAIIKMAGAPIKYFDHLNEEAFIKQADEFEKKYGGVANTAIKTLTIATSSHPWTVYRAGELLKWIDSGEYERILSKYSGFTCIHCGNSVAKETTMCPRCGLNPFD